MSTYTFHASLHARPEGPIDTGVFERDGQTFQTLLLPATELATPFALSFEAASAALALLERMFIELDGSFVWVSSRAVEPPWQVEGVLYDRHEKLLFVDLKGTCPDVEFDRLLAAVGWPATPLVFQLTREAVLLDEAEFRRYVG
jgi:hypothetical protein